MLATKKKMKNCNTFLAQVLNSEMELKSEPPSELRRCLYFLQHNFDLTHH